MLQNHFDIFMDQAYSRLNSDSIAVAVSGGCDSMALLHLAQNWAQETGHKIIALTVDHGLRKEAANEAAKVKEWSKKIGVEHCTIKNEDDQIPETGKIEYAREVRYALMTNWCLENEVYDILVAHHAEDQAETTLMRMQRGSGIDGLCAMKPISYRGNIRIIRPLLSAMKKQLKDFLIDIEQEWIEDPTNNDESFSRNKLRMALNEAAGDDYELLIRRLATSSKALSDAQESLDFVTEQYFIQHATFEEAGFIRFNHKILRVIPKDLGYRLLNKILSSLNGQASIPRFEELSRLYSEIIDNRNFAGCTLWGCEIMPTKDGIIFLREANKIAQNTIIKPGETLIWDNRILISMLEADAINQLNIITNVERILNLLPEIEKKKVEKSLTKKALRTIPIFVYDNFDGNLENIVAIPHINYYKDDVYREHLLCRLSPLENIENGSIRYCPNINYAVT